MGTVVAGEDHWKRAEFSLQRVERQAEGFEAEGSQKRLSPFLPKITSAPPV
jgi:hypothetical protein